MGCIVSIIISTYTCRAVRCRRVKASETVMYKPASAALLHTIPPLGNMADLSKVVAKAKSTLSNSSQSSNNLRHTTVSPRCTISSERPLRSTTRTPALKSLANVASSSPMQTPLLVEMNTKDSTDNSQNYKKYHSETKNWFYKIKGQIFVSSLYKFFTWHFPDLS